MKKLEEIEINKPAFSNTFHSLDFYRKFVDGIVKMKEELEKWHKTGDRLFILNAEDKLKKSFVNARNSAMELKKDFPEVVQSFLDQLEEDYHLLSDILFRLKKESPKEVEKVFEDLNKDIIPRLISEYEEK